MKFNAMHGVIFLIFGFVMIISYLTADPNEKALDLAFQLFALLLIALLLYNLEEYSPYNPRKEAIFVQPSVGQLVIRGKYEIPFVNVDDVKDILSKEMNYGHSGRTSLWIVKTSGNIVEMSRELGFSSPETPKESKTHKKYFEKLKSYKGSTVRDVELVLIPENEKMIAEIVAKPIMYFRVTQVLELRQLKQQVEDVEIEVTQQIRKIAVGILKGIELESPGPTNKKPDDIFDESFLVTLPKEVAFCLGDANKCFAAGITAPCSVMIRKGIENAIRIKFTQIGRQREMYSEDEKEITFDMKLTKASTEFPAVRGDIKTIRNTVKWFGDKGTHDPSTAITLGDIKDNVVPKTKAFIINLQLKK